MNEEESEYLFETQGIIYNGATKRNRTAVRTKSVFGLTFEYSLDAETFPLLTTKKMFIRGIIEELLWMISGSTDSNKLSAKKVHIWDGNATREFLDARGLQHRRIGDLGPVYGFQWRHFGAKYVDCDTDYTGQGVDQLKQVIETLKKDPDSRRIVMSAWNPVDLDQMALPPCHMFCQFYVENGYLSCLMYQRSADMGLGVPFNIASYSLLTRIVAQCAGLRAYKFIHVIGDAHVYTNHIDALTQQIDRKPRPFPKLKIDPSITDIDSFTYESFELIGYDPYDAIPMEMVV